MRTWPEKHPDWEYRVYDNDFLIEFPFRNRRLINEYFWRGEYAGVQDLMRYEILFTFGGFMADADSICRYPVDELLDQKTAYTVYDREDVKAAGVSPFLACEPGNPVVGEIIERLSSLEPWDLKKPWRSTGNRFLIEAIKEIGISQVKIWPSHYFIPWHFTTPDRVYTGPDRVYAEQQWGTTRYAYNKADSQAPAVRTKLELVTETITLRQSLAKSASRIGAQKSPAIDEAGPASGSRGILSWQEVVKRPEWIEDLANLNSAIADALIAKGCLPRVSGEPFYSFRQNTDLPAAPMMVKSEALRSKMADWMSQGTSILQVGFDSGHITLLQMHLTPQSTVLAVDPGGRLAKSRADAANICTATASRWLANRFGESVKCFVGWPKATLERVSLSKARPACDLLHINGITSAFLGCYGVASKMLKPNSLIILTHTGGEELNQRILQLQMLGEDISLLEMKDFGPKRGAMAVFRTSGG